jgi:hypothetical protein
VSLLAATVSVEEEPATIDPGVAVRVTVGAGVAGVTTGGGGGGVTTGLELALLLADPQPNTYVMITSEANAHTRRLQNEVGLFMEVLRSGLECSWRKVDESNATP